MVKQRQVFREGRLWDAYEYKNEIERRRAFKEKRPARLLDRDPVKAAPREPRRRADHGVPREQHKDIIRKRLAYKAQTMANKGHGLAPPLKRPYNGNDRKTSVQARNSGQMKGLARLPSLSKFSSGDLREMMDMLDDEQMWQTLESMDRDLAEQASPRNVDQGVNGAAGQRRARKRPGKARATKTKR